MLKDSLSMFEASTFHGAMLKESLEHYVMLWRNQPNARAQVVSTLYVLAHQKCALAGGQLTFEQHDGGAIDFCSNAAAVRRLSVPV